MLATEDGTQESLPRKRLLFFSLLVLSASAWLFALGEYILFLNTPPEQFPVGADITIEEGTTVDEITEFLKSESVVRSSLHLYLVLGREHPEEPVKAGTYRFEEPLSATEVASALVLGEHQSPLLRLTLPEGFHAVELSSYLPEHLKGSSTEHLRHLEGYLFPDTYFVSTETTLEDIVRLLQENFREKIAPLSAEIDASPFTLEETITLASIIEREAGDTESKHLVSGILQNRLSIDMPLQVDAIFDYLLGKTSAELTDEDLNLDSPYNTYRYRGLPPGPIANPGLESIRAVLEPTETDYLYYLTGNDGTFYYAKTFEEHKENKERYLR